MLSFVPEDAEDDAKSLTKTKAHHSNVKRFASR